MSPIPIANRSRERTATTSWPASSPGASDVPRPTCPVFAQGYRNLFPGFWIPFCDNSDFFFCFNTLWRTMDCPLPCNGRIDESVQSVNGKDLIFFVLFSTMYGQKRVPEKWRIIVWTYLIDLFETLHSFNSSESEYFFSNSKSKTIVETGIAESKQSESSQDRKTDV